MIHTMKIKLIKNGVAPDPEKRANSLGTESINKLLIRMSIPSIIAMTVNAFYNLIDAIFISYLGTAAIGAVSIAFPIFAMVGAFGLLFGIGTASYVSRLLGAKDKERADQTASISILISALTSFLFVISGLFLLQPLLRNFGATDTIMPFAQVYTRILLFGSFFTILNMNLNHIVRSEGNPKLSMNAMLIGAFTNIILDPVFIFLFGWGIAGAAIATVISQAITFFLLFRYFVSKSSYLHIRRKYLTFNLAIIWEILKIGFPSFVRQFLASFSIALINLSASLYGDPAVAAIGIVFRVISIGMFPLFGFAQGFQPIASFNFGAKNIDRLLQTVRLGYRWSTIFCTIFALICIIFAHQIIRLFSVDQDVLSIGKLSIWAVSSLFPFFGYQIITAVLFTAIGDGVPAAILSLARQGLFLIPAIILLPRFYGLYGVIFSQTLADFLTIFLTLIMSFRIIRKLKKYQLEHDVS
jgi:putative MATE family efflux protein